MSKPVYALIGSDAYLQLEKLASIAKELGPDVQRMDLDGERAELAEALDELRSYAMFGGSKLVVMRNADAFITRFREQMETYLSAPSSSGTLILRLNALPSNQRIYKIIAKVGQIEACKPPKAADLPRWIQNHAKSAHAVTIAMDAAQLLADFIGEDMGRVDNEIAKLALQSSGGKISIADVQKGVSFQREQEMWNMTDALAAGRVEEALRRWRQLVAMDSSAEFRAVTWLAMWLEKVRAALQMKSEGQDSYSIAQTLKIWPRDQVAKFMETAQRLGEPGVAKAIDMLIKVDRNSKSGVGNPADNIERYMITVAHQTRREATPLRR